MFLMILQMTGVTFLYVLLTVALWYLTRNKKLNLPGKVLIGIVFGISSILSTHYGIAFDNMVINVRDIGPLAAGLFFSPTAGIIAGLMGGIERYIAGTYFGVGSYTRIACSVSTCLAGFVALLMNRKMFKGKKPSPFYAFFMGAVMEVFHMYVVFVTHRNDMRMAFLVVSTCAIPMIIFTGIGMAVSSGLLQVFTGEWHNPFRKIDEESESLSQKFQRWLFLVVSIVILGSFLFSFILQTQSADQDCRLMLTENYETIRRNYLSGERSLRADSTVSYCIIGPNRQILKGVDGEKVMLEEEYTRLMQNLGTISKEDFKGVRSMVYADRLDVNTILVTAMSISEVYWYRNAQAYEQALADVLLFAVIYVLIAFLVNQIVVNNIRMINESLGKITNGNLNEVVSVRNSSEFASLSDDINQTVVALKGYIEAAEKKIEQELILAQTIQASALPQVFKFPDREDLELFATMKPAKEVGGDFYDFFFVDRDNIALVIADVSGKGIPAALFMMRSKTAIRSFAKSGCSPEDVISKANEALCEGNDAEMFVTVWIGIVNMVTGHMRCANAGHEYPVIKRAGGDYEIIKDVHSMPLAAFPGIKAAPYEMQLHNGDRVFVYTDGVPEAINDSDEQYGTERMLDTLNGARNKSITETLPIISESINEFKQNADQFDDITMLGFEFINPKV
ncbi:MAG: SpoIIE family protein phosphatase [Lachnospiraceae bacterium]|nr:SpoIIE family protein phosphatase [Lachnospiraceae bacterium]